MTGWAERSTPTVAGLVLAAGAGRRFGRPKALAALDGELLVERAVAALAAGGCSPIAVVLGAARDEVRRRARFPVPVLAVDNEDWATGVGSSLRAGLDALLRRGAHAALVVPVDLPGLTPAAVDRVRRTATAEPGTPGTIRPGAALAVATYQGRRGHPVLIGRAHWAGVARSAAGDTGARPYLARRKVTLVECGDVGDPVDVDLPEDLEPWRNAAGGAPGTR
ncbi:nucleotidyltransferase family protein [Actinoalloteichus caeruleus]|uniref:nucleotidyltransferase family protein n=1 Tax=Actinoalloteichus cyanogriseus TaxID=2893586 RepID=UPI003AAB5C95